MKRRIETSDDDSSEDESKFQEAAIAPDTLLQSSKLLSKSKSKFPETHCSKSSFFVQKFNFDFPRKIVELFWVKTRENAEVLDFLAVDNFDFTRKLSKKNLGKNS